MEENRKLLIDRGQGNILGEQKLPHIWDTERIVDLTNIEPDKLEPPPRDVQPEISEIGTGCAEFLQQNLLSTLVSSRS